MVTQDERKTVARMILADKKYRRYECEANESLVLSELAKIEAPDSSLFIQRVDSLIANGKLCLSPRWSEAFRIFFERHPELNCDANVEILDAALQARATHARLEALLSYDHIHRQLATTASGARQFADETERQRLVSDLVASLKPQIDGRTGKQVVYRNRTHATSYGEEVSRIEGLPLADLRQINTERLEKQRIAGLSREEIHTEMKLQAAANCPQHTRYASITPEYEIPGKSVSVPWSAQLFGRLPISEQRRLMDRFGNEQLTAAFEAARGTRNAN
jgi:hypothetical protein